MKEGQRLQDAIKLSRIKIVDALPVLGISRSTLFNYYKLEELDIDIKKKAAELVGKTIVQIFPDHLDKSTNSTVYINGIDTNNTPPPKQMKSVPLPAPDLTKPDQKEEEKELAVDKDSLALSIAALERIAQYSIAALERAVGKVVDKLPAGEKLPILDILSIADAPPGTLSAFDSSIRDFQELLIKYRLDSKKISHEALLQAVHRVAKTVDPKHNSNIHSGKDKQGNSKA